MRFTKKESKYIRVNQNDKGDVSNDGITTIRKCSMVDFKGNVENYLVLHQVDLYTHFCIDVKRISKIGEDEDDKVLYGKQPKRRSR